MGAFGRFLKKFSTSIVLSLSLLGCGPFTLNAEEGETPIGLELKNFEERVFNRVGYLGTTEFSEDQRLMAIRCYSAMAWKGSSAERRKNLLALVDRIRESPFPPLYGPIIEESLNGVKFALLHQEKERPELLNLQKGLVEIQSAIKADSLVEGYPSETALKINKNGGWTPSNVVELELYAQLPTPGKIVEVAFSEDGATYMPFRPFESVITNYPLSDIEGVKRLWAIFKTDKGKVGGVAFSSIEYDKSAPKGSFIINNGEANTEAHAITLYIKAEDAFLEGLLMQIKTTDGEPNPPFIPFRNIFETHLLGLGGEKSVTVTLKDCHGFVSPPIVQWIHLVW